MVDAASRFGRLGLSPWWSLAADCPRVRQLARSLRRVPCAALSGGLDLAAGPPAPERRRAGGGGRSPSRPRDCLPLATGSLALDPQRTLKLLQTA